MQSLTLSFATFHRYLSRPTYQTPLADQTGQSLASNLRLFINESALLLCLLGFAITFSLTYTSITSNHLFQQLISRYHGVAGGLTLFAALVLAVTMLEALFRSILRLTPTNLRNTVGIVMLILILVGYKPLKEQLGTTMGFGLVMIWGVLTWLLIRHLKRPDVLARVQAFWQTNFKIIFYVVSLVYVSFITTDDFTSLTGWQVLIFPVVVGINLLYNLYFGYIRMKFGFWYAVAAHTLILGSMFVSQALLTL